MAWRVELWDGLEAGGGARKAIVQPLIQGSLTRSVDNNDSIQIAAVYSTEWLGNANVWKVLRVTDHHSNVTEWRVTQVVRQRGDGSENRVAMAGENPVNDLAVAGLIRDASTGGASYHNLGGVQLTPTQYLESFVIPATTRYGMSYNAVGTVDVTDQMDLAWDRWTPLQLTQELAVRTETELEYLRDGSSGYTINLRNARGSSASQVVFRLGRNLEVLAWKRRIESLRTVMVPAGQVVPGAVEAAGIQQTAWLIDAVTGGTSGGTIALKDPSSGDLPVQFNDQITNLWALRNTDATLEQITSATTASVIRLANTSGFSTGQHLEIRATSDGVQLTELSNPAATSAYGRVVGVYEDAQMRGERNYIANGLFADWLSAPDVVTCQADSSQSGSSLIVKNLPTSGVVIKAGSKLHRYTALQFVNDIRITADVTASTVGTATLTLATTQGAFSASEDLWIFRNGSSQLPSLFQSDTNSFVGMDLGRRSVAVTGSLTGNSTGTYSGNASHYALTGLSANAEINAGDLIAFSSGVNKYRILGYAAVTSSGTATVAIHRGPAATDGTSVTITRPSLSQDGGNNCVVTFAQQQLLGVAGTKPYIESPSLMVRYDATLPALWLSAGISYHALSSQAITAASTVFDSLVFQLWDKNSSAVVTSVTDADRDLTAESVTDVTLRLQAMLSSSRKLCARLYPPVIQQNAPNVSYDPDPFVYLRWLTMTLGPDPEVPPINGSWGNQLWQRTNRKLAEYSQDPDVYQVSVKDLSAITGYPSSDEALVLGGTVRLYDSVLGVDKQLRIMQITHDLLDPTNTQVVLASRPRLLTDIVSEQKPQNRIFVSVDIAGTTSTAGNAGGGTGVPISTAPNVVIATGTNPAQPGEQPAQQPGAYRAVAPTSGASTGDIVRVIWRKGGYQ